MGMPHTDKASVHVDAPPEAVYDLVADISRMGEWSPECVRTEWQGEPGEVGSRFKGWNRRGLARWSTTAEVIAAERGKEFAFTTKAGDKDATRWRYRFTPDGEGTELEESYESVWTPPLIAFAERYIVRNRDRQLVDGMQRTLERIKAAAERR
jgi:uncharacterized protein YndB with AHSA1/START domain